MHLAVLSSQPTIIRQLRVAGAQVNDFITIITMSEIAIKNVTYRAYLYDDMKSGFHYELRLLCDIL